MELKQAQTLAREIIDKLAPYCERIRVVGSIRRQRLFPRDIDLVLIPKNQGQLALAIKSLGEPLRGGKILEQRVYKGVQVDFYFATAETWATLGLVRTGSKAHNIKLATLCKARNWQLHADGRGLYNEKGERIAGDTEKSFFEALGIPYAHPRERER